MNATLYRRASDLLDGTNAVTDSGIDHAAIAADPAGFYRDWLGFDAWSKQIEIAEAVRDHPRVAVRSCHSSGKTASAARLIVWFLHAHPHSVVITTAPTGNQVRNQLWREVNTAVRGAKRPLLGDCMVQSINIAPDWFALGFKAADAEPSRFQGFHSAALLVIIDEAAGVSEAVYEALQSSLTSAGSRLLLLGNPTSTSGTFYDAFHRRRDQFHTIAIPAEATPNFGDAEPDRPYLITPAWADEMLLAYGEASAYVQSRVYAEFPRYDSDALIPLSLIEAAAGRDIPTVTEPLAAGLDVGYTGDESCLQLRSGPAVLATRAWHGLDTMQTVGRVRQLVAGIPAFQPPSPTAAINVDANGIGLGVANRLQELGYRVNAVNVGTRSSDPERFRNLRDELWWNLRERFAEENITGVTDETLIAQLSSIRFKFDSRHTGPMVESKDEMKKRGLRSPDRADALALAFYTAPETTIPLVGPAGGVRATRERAFPSQLGERPA